MPWPCDQGHRAGKVMRSSIWRFRQGNLCVAKPTVSVITTSWWRFSLESTNVQVGSCLDWEGRECWPQMLPTDKATWRKRRLTLLPDVVAWPNKADEKMPDAPHLIRKHVYDSTYGEYAFSYVCCTSTTQCFSDVNLTNHLGSDIRYTTRYTSQAKD